jgi:hypothetical protein
MKGKEIKKKTRTTREEEMQNEFGVTTMATNG